MTLQLYVTTCVSNKQYGTGFLDVNVAKCNLGKVKLQANAVSGLLLKRTWSEGCPQGPFAYLVTYVASHAGIFELIFADLLLSESLRILLLFAGSSSLQAPWRAVYFGWFPLAGLPWIPPCYAWGVQAPVQPLRHQFPSSSIGDEFNSLNDSMCVKFPCKSLPQTHTLLLKSPGERKIFRNKHNIWYIPLVDY